ncbi:hypothetical protein [Janthinobacterium psychrotolerans]|uniref:hypothetical protein n=2 Tax=Janthinobacterium TaxID=29580 RepID=UPI001495A53A|nr:hypothetical protein [Janthinobacterium psychrotolerans]
MDLNNGENARFIQAPWDSEKLVVDIAAPWDFCIIFRAASRIAATPATINNSLLYNSFLALLLSYRSLFLHYYSHVKTLASPFLYDRQSTA